jgi:predicted transcriptional regulator
MPLKQIKRLKKPIFHKDRVSQRGLAKRFNVSQPYIFSQIIKNKTNFRYRKKTKAPIRTPAQKAALRPKYGK